MNSFVEKLLNEIKKTLKRIFLKRSSVISRTIDTLTCYRTTAIEVKVDKLQKNLVNFHIILEKEVPEVIANSFGISKFIKMARFGDRITKISI